MSTLTKKKKICSQQSRCLSFSYSIHDGETCRRFMTDNSNLNIILQPSRVELTFVKTKIDNSIIDQSRAPSSISVDIPFKTHWSEENLNGIYHRITDQLYNKPALYNPDQNITLEYADETWTFQNHDMISNYTVLAYSNSSVHHPGLFSYAQVQWNVIDAADHTDMKTFPLVDGTQMFMAVNNRNVLYFT